MTLNAKIGFYGFFGDFGLPHNSIAFAKCRTQLTRYAMQMEILVFVY